MLREDAVAIKVDVRRTVMVAGRKKQKEASKVRFEQLPMWRRR
jgi:hypothetical protein